jgi:hypothetical protein
MNLLTKSIQIFIEGTTPHSISVVNFIAGTMLISFVSFLLVNLIVGIIYGGDPK